MRLSLVAFLLVPASAQFFKPGTCPVPLGSGSCNRECSSDADCILDQKCCSNNCGLVCLNPVVPPKPGRCPRSKGFDLCFEFCRGDDQCEGDKKCCETACGKFCKTPIFGKPGQCPDFSQLPVSSPCFARCLSDADCPGVQKCCGNDCTSFCIDPIFSDCLNV